MLIPELDVLVPVCGAELVLVPAVEPAADPVWGSALYAISTVDPNDPTGRSSDVGPEVRAEVEQ